MRVDRRLAIAVAIALVAVAALPAAASLRLGSTGLLVLAGAIYALWLGRRGEWSRHDRPAARPPARLSEIVSARVEEPVGAAVPFVLRRQQGRGGEDWAGAEPLWIVVSESALWLLHRGVGGSVGGVKSRFGRDGLHSRWIDHRLHSQHVAELSWPSDPWFVMGELLGSQPQRLRLIGLLAGDELGVRELVTRGQ